MMASLEIQCRHIWSRSFEDLSCIQEATVAVIGSNKIICQNKRFYICKFKGLQDRYQVFLFEKADKNVELCTWIVTVFCNYYCGANWFIKISDLVNFLRGMTDFWKYWCDFFPTKTRSIVSILQIIVQAPKYVLHMSIMSVQRCIASHSRRLQANI